jgi:hypothetical protein
VLAVGDCICHQQRHFSLMRLGTFHHTCSHHQGTQDRHAGQAKAREHNDARFAGDRIVDHEDVPGDSWPVGGMFYPFEVKFTKANTDLSVSDVQPDQSWSYNSLLTIEVAEIGSTLVALSVPALKPFFAKFFTFLDTTWITNVSSRAESRRGSKRESGFGLVNWRKKVDSTQSEPSEIAVRHSLAVTNEELGIHKWNTSHTAIVSAGGHSIASGRSEEQLGYWTNTSATQR